MRQLTFVFCVVAAFMGPFRLGNAAETFVTGFEDLPLMPGLVQVQQDSLLFDTPQGRIVQASAIGAVAEEAALSFYAATLPQLGWRASNQMTYHREGETLRIEFKKAGQVLTVRFLSEPKSSTPSLKTRP